MYTPQWIFANRSIQRDKNVSGFNIRDLYLPRRVSHRKSVTLEFAFSGSGDAKKRPSRMGGLEITPLARTKKNAE